MSRIKYRLWSESTKTMYCNDADFMLDMQGQLYEINIFASPVCESVDDF